MDDLKHWLWLTHTPRIGPKTTLKILNHFAHPAAVQSALCSKSSSNGLSEKCRQALRNSLHSAQLQNMVEKTTCWLTHPDHHLLTLHDERYPPQLKTISDPPPLLYVDGDPDVLLTPAIGIVGSRKATPGGMTIAGDIATQLSQYGLSIASGLALGVDQSAHVAALKNDALTIAVAGTGLDRVYPARHIKLAAAIAAKGAVASELPLGSAPLPHHFPRRNRIISGLSIGVVIIEAGCKSGTLSTAAHARDQGREVMVVPGSIKNPASRGCNSLIRQGATLVRDADDIITEIAPQIDIDPRLSSGSAPSDVCDPAVNEESTCMLLNIMGFDPITIDSLIAQSGQGADQVSRTLSLLELKGQVSSLSGGRYVRC